MNDKLKIVRPLREVNLKEASACLWWNGLRVVPHVSTEKTRGIRELLKGVCADDFETYLSKGFLIQISFWD